MVYLLAANYIGNQHIVTSSGSAVSFGSTLGAAVVGFLGHIYSRLRKVNAFTIIVPGILLLVPVRHTVTISSIPSSDA